MKLLILGAGAVVVEYYLPVLEMLGILADAFIIDQSHDAIKTVNARFLAVKCKQVGFEEFFHAPSRDCNFEAAIVALPNSLHLGAVEMALHNGLHVLCEKPLAMRQEDCLRLGRLAEGAGKVLAVGMVRRLIPSWLVLSEALKNGLIGNLKSIEIECGESYVWLSETGSFFKKENGGILADMGVHYLDFLQELLGGLVPVSYEDDCRGGVEANCIFRLISSQGIPVGLKLSRTHTLANKMVFKGEGGELITEKDVFDFCVWHPSNLNNLSVRIYSRKPYQSGDWPVSFTSCFAEQLWDFQGVIRQGKPCRASWQQAAMTMQLIEWAYNHRQEKKDKIPGRSSVGIFEIRPFLRPARVVVTGGTGFIGGHLVSRLVDLGCSEITVPVRHYKTCAEVARFPIRMPRINLLDYKQVKTTIQGAQFVFHLAYGRDGYDAARITVEGTKNVVNAAIECGVECVVIPSTMYVFGHPDTDELVDESWPYHPAGGEYGRSKAEMERWCLWRARNAGSTRIVVLNPSCVYGPKGKTYTQLPIQMAGQGNFCWVEEGRGIANYTFIDNLIDAIILAINCKEAHGQRFIINDGFCSWREFLTPLLGEFAASLSSFSRKDLVQVSRGQRAKIKDVIIHLSADLELLDIINRAPFLGAAKRILFRPIPKLRFALIEKRAQQTAYPEHSLALKYPPEWLGDIFGPTKTKFSAEKAKKILGWRPLISLGEGQEIVSSWLKSVGLL